MTDLIALSIQVSVVGLERALQQYCRDQSAHEIPFDLKIVPVSAQPITATERKKPSVSVDMPTTAAKMKEEKVKATRQDVYGGLSSFFDYFFKQL